VGPWWTTTIALLATTVPGYSLLGSESTADDDGIAPPDRISDTTAPPCLGAFCTVTHHIVAWRGETRNGQSPSGCCKVLPHSGLPLNRVQCSLKVHVLRMGGIRTSHSTKMELPQCASPHRIPF
jgi:hypothetical protein